MSSGSTTNYWHHLRLGPCIALALQTSRRYFILVSSIYKDQQVYGRDLRPAFGSTGLVGALDLADASSGVKGRFGKCTPVSIVKPVNRLRTDFCMKGKLEQRKSSQLVFERGGVMKT